MAVGGPGCRCRERRRGAVSCCASDGLFIFSQLGWLLSSTDTPAPLPQEEREGPRGPGESPLPQREGGAAPRYHLCSGAGAEPRLCGAGCHLLPPGALLTWNGMIRAPTATPHPVAGLVSSHPAPMAAINGALFCGIWPRHLSQAKAPGAQGCTGGKGGRVGQRAGERVPKPAPVPPSWPTASSPPGRSRVGGTRQSVLLSHIWQMLCWVETPWTQGQQAAVCPTWGRGTGEDGRARAPQQRPEAGGMSGVKHSGG